MLNSEYLSNLNENQREAVECLDGPLLIVAGAGSGKTKVLTSRIAHIIKKLIELLNISQKDHKFKSDSLSKFIMRYLLF